MKHYEGRFNQMLERSIRENWEEPALTDYVSGFTYNYKDIAAAIEKMHILYREMGIKPDDKIALVGKNTPEWGIVFLSAVSYGAIIVPILQNFPVDDIHHIVNHSESSLLFVSDNFKDQILEENIKNVKAVFCYSDKTCLFQREQYAFPLEPQSLRAELDKKYPKGMTSADVVYADKAPGEVFSINYTSGTTGFSKGVLQLIDNITGNIGFIEEVGLSKKGNKILTFLPLAHTYGCTLDFLSQVSNGAHITFLNKLPAPNVLIKAFSEIRPSVIFTVPLVVEKIFRAVAEPIIVKAEAEMSQDQLETKVYPEVREKLIQLFGGQFKQVVVGGAPLNADIEASLKKIKFPFCVGYGMTECSPLISFVDLDRFVAKSVGVTLPNLDVRIDSEDQENVVGEILVKGQNVMGGYYKDPETTANVIDKEGWLHTGDLGTLDKHNNLFIKGRCKTMILGPSGQNIYPEALEAKINNMPYVSECLVIEGEKGLMALVYPDFKLMDENHIDEKRVMEIMEENRKKYNQMVANYEQVTEVRLYPNEFEKTPKKSIKRYLYQSNGKK